MNTIGRIDKADFPELHLNDIELKVDTGAYTSSIHCHNIKQKEVDGVSHVEFQLLDPSYPMYSDKVFRVKNFKEKGIRSSFGNIEQRFVINTLIVIFGEEHPIELSLSERSDMKFPILLGRKFLNKRLIVNTARTNLSFKLKKKQQKSKK
ncbi:MAG: hypothetical protein ACI9JN_001385 [Bacteroidia bacterium]|jgi:hypothetical protein